MLKWTERLIVPSRMWNTDVRDQYITVDSKINDKVQKSSPLLSKARKWNNHKVTHSKVKFLSAFGLDYNCLVYSFLFKILTLHTIPLVAYLSFCKVL